MTCVLKYISYFDVGLKILHVLFVEETLNSGKANCMHEVFKKDLIFSKVFNMRLSLF
jgi:hypothetical protein